MLIVHTDLLFTSCHTYGPGLLGTNLKTVSVFAGKNSVQFDICWSFITGLEYMEFDYFSYVFKHVCLNVTEYHCSCLQ